MNDESAQAIDNRIQEEAPSIYAKGPDTRDWRITFGIGVTAVWILTLTLYISGAVGWANISAVPIDILGSFLEGSFAPLAFLWFVLAYFSQQKELSQNTEAIRLQSIEMQRSVEQAAIQSSAISASEMHARRESFLRLWDIVKDQQGYILGFLFISSQGASGTGQVSGEQISMLWNEMGKGDPEIFSRQMLELRFIHGEAYAYKLMFGTAVRTRHSKRFIHNFERLLQAAKECDSNEMIYDAVIGSAHGYIYEIMVGLRDVPPPGFKFEVYDFDPDSGITKDLDAI